MSLTQLCDVMTHLQHVPARARHGLVTMKIINIHSDKLILFVLVVDNVQHVSCKNAGSTAYFV